jgi:FMN-dependent NADH-azoreductase
MTTLNIRQRLHHFIDTIEDKKAVAIYTLLEDEMDADAQRKKLVIAEREKYLKGEGGSYSWEEVKAMATDKTMRNGI